MAEEWVLRSVLMSTDHRARKKTCAVDDKDSHAKQNREPNGSSQKTAKACLI